MPALHDLQHVFHAAVVAPLFEPTSGIALPLVAPSVGMLVYRNNLREGARKALAADYPVVERLVGASCWRQLARDYVERHPSASGDLQDFGGAFAEFLATRYSRDEFGYLVDVANLERAIDESLQSEMRPALETSILATLPATEWSAAGLSLQPSTRLLCSMYPVLDIWQANRVTDEPMPINLASGGHHLLVLRDTDDVTVRRLTPGMHRFLSVLSEGDSLSAAVIAALTCEPELDPGRALSQIFSWQLVHDIQTPRLDTLTQGDPA